MRKFFLQFSLLINGASICLLFVFIFIILSNNLYAQTPDTSLSAAQLKKLSLEQLMDIEVTSVSKHPEKLSEAASAIQVITQEDIRRSGAKTLAEALELASNLQVAQVNSSQWAISARGFDNVLSNKLLVLIDGRVVYTPLYAGVFWDVQNVMLEDVDRIEVISGPGGTLWGENAVNGVINIITKSAKDTKGLFVEGGLGNDLPGIGSIRLGSELAKNLYCRIYGTGFDMGNTFLTDGKSSKDAWSMAQGGGRIDWDASKKDNISFQANLYDGNPNPNGGDTPVITKGDNVVALWKHTLSNKSDFQLQAYYDHTYRNFGSGLTEDLKTYDLDWQNRYQIGRRNNLTYGLGARVMDDDVTNAEVGMATLGFFPPRQTLYLFSAFAQDEILLIKDLLHFTIGSKVENNNYTGFEYEPDVRLALTPSQKQTIWAAVSRAVRAPSRIDRDFGLYLAPTLPVELGNPDFISETMVAYELGWRLEPLKNLSISLSTFYNVYNDIRSAGPGDTVLYLGVVPVVPIVFGNGVDGQTYGAELSATYQLTKWWKVRGGYTFLQKKLSVKAGDVDLNNATAESDDPENQFLIQTYADLPGGLELGTVLRYVDDLPQPYVPDYFGLDASIGWKINKIVEISIIGQDLLDKFHTEFIPSSPSAREIERSYYAKITCRL